MAKEKRKKKIKRVPATTANLTNAVINFLLSRGHLAFPIYNGAVYDPSIMSFRKKKSGAFALTDIMGIINPLGQFIGIEVKNQETEDSIKDDQYEFRDLVVSRGGLHYFCHTYADFIEWYNKNIFDDGELVEIEI
jgi:hypothetical protein